VVFWAEPTNGGIEPRRMDTSLAALREPASSGGLWLIEQTEFEIDRINDVANASLAFANEPARESYEAWQRAQWTEVINRTEFDRFATFQTFGDGDPVENRIEDLPMVLAPPRPGLVPSNQTTWWLTDDELASLGGFLVPNGVTEGWVLDVPAGDYFLCVMPSLRCAPLLLQEATRARLYADTRDVSEATGDQIGRPAWLLLEHP
jgi:hypothetical protein